MVLLPGGRRNTPRPRGLHAPAFLYDVPPQRGQRDFLSWAVLRQAPSRAGGPPSELRRCQSSRRSLKNIGRACKNRPFRGGGFCSEFFERSLPAQSPAATQRPPRGRKPVKERNAPRGRSFMQKMDPAQNRTPLHRGQRAALHFGAGAARFLRCMGSLQAVTPGSPFRRRVGD